MRYDSTINQNVERFISDKTLERYQSKFGQEFIDWYDNTDDETNAKLTYLDMLHLGYIPNFESLLNELEQLGNEKNSMYV